MQTNHYKTTPCVSSPGNMVNLEDFRQKLSLSEPGGMPPRPAGPAGRTGLAAGRLCQCIHHCDDAGFYALDDFLTGTGKNRPSGRRSNWTQFTKGTPCFLCGVPLLHIFYKKFSNSAEKGG